VCCQALRGVSDSRYATRDSNSGGMGVRLECRFDQVGGHFQSAGLSYHLLEISGSFAVAWIVQYFAAYLKCRGVHEAEEMAALLIVRSENLWMFSEI
jgi:hypothetical protein